MGPEPTATTSINWWPYPAWGQSATPTPTPTPAPTVPARLPALTDGGSTLPTISPTPTTSSSSSPSPSSPTSSASLIQLTALPASSSNPTHPTHPTQHRPFTLLYLTPLFALAGLALGALLGYLLFLLLRRRSRHRQGRGRKGKGKGPQHPSFQFGPPYMPMPVPAPGGEVGEAMQEVALHAHADGGADVGSPSKYSRHGTPYLGAPAFALHPGGSGSGSGSVKDGLLAPPRVRRGRSRSHSRSSGLTNTNSNHKNKNEKEKEKETDARRALHMVASPDPPSVYSQTDDEDVDMALSACGSPYTYAYDARRQGSIRRGILARLQGAAHSSPAPVSMGDGTASMSMSPGSGSGSACGFRIVQESPDPVPAFGDQASLHSALAREPRESWLAWTKAWSPASVSASPDVGGADRYTAVPARRLAQDKHSQGIGSPVRKSVDVDVLPASPRQVMSPPLASQLLFTPPPPAFEGVPRTARSDKHKRRASASAESESGVSSIASPGRETARAAALDRVDAIVASSYSARDVRPRSPTMFGAVGAREEFPWAGGIEQRLAGMHMEG
ncbi:hypothetical protein DENSPDRAFT_881882 [Dentipellis sp. KUC8613]|nr:hypothetical protein DENSPDRAFT_881882 [Dentipellis sp. KUC8613]